MRATASAVLTVIVALLPKASEAAAPRGWIAAAYLETRFEGADEEFAGYRADLGFPIATYLLAHAEYSSRSHSESFDDGFFGQSRSRSRLEFGSAGLVVPFPIGAATGLAGVSYEHSKASLRISTENLGPLGDTQTADGYGLLAGLQARIARGVAIESAVLYRNATSQNSGGGDEDPGWRIRLAVILHLARRLYLTASYDDYREATDLTEWAIGLRYRIGADQRMQKPSG